MQTRSSWDKTILSISNIQISMNIYMILHGFSKCRDFSTMWRYSLWVRRLVSTRSLWQLKEFKSAKIYIAFHNQEIQGSQNVKKKKYFVTTEEKKKKTQIG